MTSFLRGLLKGNHSKHKKLLEDSSSISKDAESESDGILESSGSCEGDSIEVASGTRFRVKYLGSSLVETPNGQVATAEAIKTVVQMARASGKKLQRVIVTVNLRGIKVLDAVTEEPHFDISIYSISYCSADAAHNHVFAFIATNSNDIMECHAFLCPKKKVAQNATLAIARTFNTAYELWRLSREGPPADKNHDEEVTEPAATKNPPRKKSANIAIEGYQRRLAFRGKGKKHLNDGNGLLIDFTKDLDTIPIKGKSWVSFDDDDSDSDTRGTMNRRFSEKRNGSDTEEDCYGSIDLLRFS